MRNPLRLFLIQLLPVLVFLAVDAIVEDPAWAIGSALAFVVVQSAIAWKQNGSLDRFVLLDGALIGGLGMVSLLTRDDLFFKLKPAIVEGLMVPFLLVLALAPTRWLEGYFQRYTAGQKIQPPAFEMMRRLMIWMAILVALHACAVVFAARQLSRAWWGWISGPGFLLVFLPLAGWVLYQRRKMKLAAVAARPQGHRTRRVRQQ